MEQLNPVVGRRRLSSQHLGVKPFSTPADVVRWMGAMQAQDYGQSLWAIGSRLRSPSLAAVLDAVESGQILRTWPMRGTIHWVPAEDARWMVALSGERTLSASRTRRSVLAIDDVMLQRAGSVLVEALTGGRRLNRPAVMALWSAAGIAVDGQRGYHLLWHLAHTGLIAIGPMDGKQQTFALLEEFAVSAPSPSRSDALVELARRYLQSHAPASVRDFAWWAGITLTDARAGFAGTGVTSETVGERELFGDVLEAPRRAGPVLLAGFDEFVLGYQQRSDVLDPAFADRVVPGNNGIFQPCVVADGRVVGVWKRVVRKTAVDIAVGLFQPGTVARDDLSGAAQQYAEFLGLGLGKLTLE